eukprot:13228655-Alexandrium_andersonii.AAC.1
MAEFLQTEARACEEVARAAYASVRRAAAAAEGQILASPERQRLYGQQAIPREGLPADRGGEPAAKEAPEFEANLEVPLGEREPPIKEAAHVAT